jgi:hypothetical protein
MRHRILMITLLLALAAPAARQSMTEEERRKIEQQMMATAQPGPEHSRLAKLAGAWDVEITMWSPAAVRR